MHGSIESIEMLHCSRHFKLAQHFNVNKAMFGNIFSLHFKCFFKICLFVVSSQYIKIRSILNKIKTYNSFQDFTLINTTCSLSFFWTQIYFPTLLQLLNIYNNIIHKYFGQNYVMNVRITCGVNSNDWQWIAFLPVHFTLLFLRLWL